MGGSGVGRDTKCRKTGCKAIGVVQGRDNRSGVQRIGMRKTCKKENQNNPRTEM